MKKQQGAWMQYTEFDEVMKILDKAMFGGIVYIVDHIEWLQ